MPAPALVGQRAIKPLTAQQRSAKALLPTGEKNMRNIASIIGLAVAVFALAGAPRLVTPGMAAGVPQARNTSCDDPKTAFDNVYCERKVYMQADTDLNAAYKKLRLLLKAPDRATLLQSQRAWISQRDERCGLSEGSSIKIDLTCAKDMTIERTNWLNDRSRECTSSGCRASRLDE
jgi:uncharacterized protein YecT (DUF1311 family)